MIGRKSVVIEVGLELVYSSGYAGHAKKIVEVIQVHKDNSFRVSGLKAPDNRFIGYKMDWGENAGKIVDYSFRGYGDTSGACRVLEGGDTQEKFDAEVEVARVRKQVEKDDRQARHDAVLAAIREANEILIEQTKAPLDFDGMYTVELEDCQGNRMRVIYKPVPEEMFDWGTSEKYEGVNLHSTSYGTGTMSGSWRRDDVEGRTEHEALLKLAYQLW